MNILLKRKSLILLMVVSCLWFSCKKEEVKVLPAIQVPFVTIQKEEVPIYKEFAAQTFGELDIDLTARVDGILTGIHFKEGQRVKKGQLLYTIDPVEYDTKVDQAAGQRDVAQSNLVNAQEELNRIRPLAKINAVSIRDLDAAVAKEKAAQSNLESTKAALKNQQVIRGYCTIYSPIDGVIGLSIARLGDYISRMGASSKLNTVSKLDDVRVRFVISESEYLTYQKNRQNTNKLTDLELILSDGSVHPHKGVINFSDASIDPTTGTMTIEAQFPNPENTLRSGQFSKVRVLVRKEKDAIVVPQKAIAEMQGIYQVNAITADNKIEIRVVEVGTKVGTQWVVTKGLKAGDRVAIVGSLFIQPGSPIVPVPYVVAVSKTNPNTNN
jgi:membrane fusion protein (multidrug efflux system)